MSKSGLGVSAGVPGFRVGLIGPRGHYVHMGRGGLYYRATLDGKGRQHSEPQPTSPYPVAALLDPSQPVMDEVTDASILQLTDAEPSALVSQLTASQSKPTIWVAALVVAILVAL